MSEGTVTARGLSRTQKPTITIDGQVYSAPSVDLGGLVAGDRIQFDAASKIYNGSTVWFLNGWKMLQVASKPEPTKYPPSVPQIIERTAPEGSGALLAVTDVERPCISNWGAELIRAGVVADPASLGIWVQAALHALRGN